MIKSIFWKLLGQIVYMHGEKNHQNIKILENMVHWILEQLKLTGFESNCTWHHVVPTFVDVEHPMA